MNERHSPNTVWQASIINRQHREFQGGHRGAILWLTGLSGAGKSTLAHAVEVRLHDLGCRTFVLDGDNVRHGLCADLGFSPQERTENIRRVGEMAKLFLEAGVIVLAAFISPIRDDRRRVRRLVSDGDFIEIYCKASLEVCEARDVKGLYQRARAGEVSDFTGVSAPYEEPETPELVINTADIALEQSVDQVMRLLSRRGLLMNAIVKNPAISQSFSDLGL